MDGRTDLRIFSAYTCLKIAKQLSGGSGVPPRRIEPGSSMKFEAVLAHGLALIDPSGTAVGCEPAGRSAVRARATAYILRSHPRLSQTFQSLNEILALEGIGVELLIFAITTSSERSRQRGVDLVESPLHYFDGVRRSRRPPSRRTRTYTPRRPRRSLTTTAYVLRRRDLERGYTTASRWSYFVALPCGG